MAGRNDGGNMPTKQQTDAWMQRMDEFRAKLRGLEGTLPVEVQRELLRQFEDIMIDMRMTFSASDEVSLSTQSRH
jgi:hypothetical protein